MFLALSVPKILRLCESTLSMLCSLPPQPCYLGTSCQPQGTELGVLSSRLDVGVTKKARAVF